MPMLLRLRRLWRRPEPYSRGFEDGDREEAAEEGVGGGGSERSKRWSRTDTSSLPVSSVRTHREVGVVGLGLGLELGWPPPLLWPPSTMPWSSSPDAPPPERRCGECEADTVLPPRRKSLVGVRKWARGGDDEDEAAMGDPSASTVAGSLSRSCSPPRRRRRHLVDVHDVIGGFEPLLTTAPSLRRTPLWCLREDRMSRVVLLHRALAQHGHLGAPAAAAMVEAGPSLLFQRHRRRVVGAVLVGGERQSPGRKRRG